VEPAWGKSVFARLEERQLNVQGWLMLPKDYDPKKKYPLIVEVHGGPAAAEMAHWGGGGGLSANAFSALVTSFCNPTRAAAMDRARRLPRPIAKTLATATCATFWPAWTGRSTVPGRPRPCGLTGWSYGGFMSMFAVTQTQRFKAAVAGAGIADWQSYYGEIPLTSDDTLLWRNGLRRPAVYARSSAISFIKQVKTPTLVVVGDRDGSVRRPVVRVLACPAR